METKEEVFKALIDVEIDILEAEKCDVWSKTHQEVMNECLIERAELECKLEILAELSSLENRKHFLLDKLKPTEPTQQKTMTFDEVIDEIKRE